VVQMGGVGKAARNRGQRGDGWRSASSDSENGGWGRNALNRDAAGDELSKPGPGKKTARKKDKREKAGRPVKLRGYGSGKGEVVGSNFRGGGG